MLQRLGDRGLAADGLHEDLLHVGLAVAGLELRQRALGHQPAGVVDVSVVTADGETVAPGAFAFARVYTPSVVVGALLLALLYSFIAGLFLHSARRILDQGKLGLPATMAELRADREALFE